jgi:UDP-N-acetylmuramyl pentapeptide phosphotransferase/UDP-N-acetylglucosamine-1-phosphate transferase
MKHKTLIMLFFVIAFIQNGIAQKTFDDDVNDETGQDAVPIDGGISALIGSAAAYGVIKRNQKEKKGLFK